MADFNFNTPAGQAITRGLMVLYLNTGTKEAPVWSAVGKRVTDSSMELDWGTESSTEALLLRALHEHHKEKKSADNQKNGENNVDGGVKHGSNYISVERVCKGIRR